MVQPRGPIVDSGVYALARDYLGVELDFDDRDDSVGTTAEQAVPQNPRRVYLLIQNTSSGALYIRPRQPPTTAIGIRIATGGFRSFWYQEDGPLPGLEWLIVGDAAGLTYYVLEGVIISK